MIDKSKYGELPETGSGYYTWSETAGMQRGTISNERYEPIIFRGKEFGFPNSPEDIHTNEELYERYKDSWPEVAIKALYAAIDMRTKNIAINYCGLEKKREKPLVREDGTINLQFQNKSIIPAGYIDAKFKITHKGVEWH